MILESVLYGVGERSNGLLLERGRPPVPKLGRTEGPVDGRRSTSPPFLPMNARGNRLPVRKGQGRHVTACTGDRLIRGQSLVEEQQLPKFDFFFGQGVILGDHETVFFQSQREGQLKGSLPRG